MGESDRLQPDESVSTSDHQDDNGEAKSDYHSKDTMQKTVPTKRREYEYSHVGMLKFTDDFNIEALVSSLDMDTSVHEGPLIKRMLKQGTLLLPGQKLKDVKMNKKILATWIFRPYYIQFRKVFGFSLEPEKRMFPSGDVGDILIKNLRKVMVKGGCNPDEGHLKDLLSYFKGKFANDNKLIRDKLKKEYQDNGRELFGEGTESERLDPVVQELEESDILKSTSDYDGQVNMEDNFWNLLKQKTRSTITPMLECSSLRMILTWSPFCQCWIWIRQDH